MELILATAEKRAALAAAQSAINQDEARMRLQAIRMYYSDNGYAATDTEERVVGLVVRDGRAITPAMMQVIDNWEQRKPSIYRRIRNPKGQWRTV